MSAIPLSLIVPAHGRPDLLRRCVTALHEQAPAGAEIIVVDDASEPPVDPATVPARTLRTPRQLGPPGARNFGAAAAQGAILIFVDSDVIAEPGAVARFLARFADPAVDSVMGIYALHGGDGSFFSAYKNLYWHTNQMWQADDSCNVCTALFAVRAAVFHEVGGFDPGSLLGEDRQFGLALRQKGRNTRLDKDIRGVHLKHFGLYSLLRHHFDNAGARVRLYALARGRHTALAYAGDASHGQRAAIILAPLMTLVLLLAPVMPARVSVLLVLAGSTLFVVLAHRPLRLARREKGIRFAAACALVYFAECLVAAAGLAYGFARHLLPAPRAQGTP